MDQGRARWCAICILLWRSIFGRWIPICSGLEWQASFRETVTLMSFLKPLILHTRWWYIAEIQIYYNAMYTHSEYIMCCWRPFNFALYSKLKIKWLVHRYTFISYNGLYGSTTIANTDNFPFKWFLAGILITYNWYLMTWGGPETLLTPTFIMFVAIDPIGKCLQRVKVWGWGQLVGQRGYWDEMGGHGQWWINWPVDIIEGSRDLHRPGRHSGLGR